MLDNDFPDKGKQESQSRYGANTTNSLVALWVWKRSVDESINLIKSKQKQKSQGEERMKNTMGHYIYAVSGFVRRRYGKVTFCHYAEVSKSMYLHVQSMVCPRDIHRLKAVNWTEEEMEHKAKQYTYTADQGYFSDRDELQDFFSGLVDAVQDFKDAAYEDR